MLLLFACSDEPGPAERYAKNQDWMKQELARSERPNMLNLLDSSKRAGMPLLLYFTAEDSPNSRRMERTIFTDTTVARFMQQNFVFVALHVDDATALPEANRPINSEDGAEHTTYGSMAHELQATLTGSKSQPMFLIMDHDYQMLGQRGFEPDKDEFFKFIAMATFNYQQMHH